MDNHTEQFKWDDKLVQDYIQFYAASYAASVAYFNSDETLEKFKQSKSKKEEPQWEILELRRPSDFDLIHCLKITDKRDIEKVLRDSPKEFEIFSVKRSDGEVLVVGSKDYSYGNPCKILSFRVMGNGCMWCCVEYENGNIYDSVNILSLDKLPKEEQVPIKVEWFERINPFSDYYWYQFRTNQIIPNEKSQYVKSAIEDVINNKYKPWKMYQTGFTSEELLQARRDAFDESRKTHPMIGFKHDTFEDYINSLK